MRFRLFSTILRTFICVAAAVVLLAPSIHSALAPVHTVQPDFPEELMEEGIEGNAVIKITVTAEGTVGECEVASCDHELFGEAAIAAVKQWTFTPHEVNGQPVDKKVKVPFRFRLTEELKAAMRKEQLNRRFGREVFKPLDPKIRVFRAKTLPRNQRPRNVIPLVPLYPPELKGSGKTGKVMVKFCLDVDGKVINPEILSSNDPAFESTALISLLMCQYEPVIRKTKPVYVEIRRPIVFSEDGSEGPRLEAEEEGTSEQ